MKVRDLMSPIIVLLLFLIIPLVSLYVDYLWFGEVSYTSVFLTALSAKAGLFFIGGLGFFILSVIGIKFGLRGKKESNSLYVIIAVVSFIFGVFLSNFWEIVLAYMNSTQFGIVDPVFNMDLSFYFFELPFYQLIWGVVFGVFMFSGLVAGFVHLRSSFKSVQKVATDDVGELIIERPRIKFGKNLSNIYSIVGMILIVLAIGIFLQQYSVLYSEVGVVKGAGWTDINVVLPLVYIATLITFLTGVVFLSGNVNWIKVVAAILIVFMFLGGVLVSFSQSFIVSPDEFNAEQIYIEKNIEFTRKAYGLDEIVEKPFLAEEELTIADINSNNQTMRNIRLWDWRPLLQTYKQLQLIRTYYDFEDADVDRYKINGDYKQVITSTREVNPALIPERSWINEHLVFTHGYGITMTPVRETDNGLPLLYVQDIPPQSQFFDIERPEIYFGELTSNYAIVNTMTEELDYPLGEENVYTTYEGNAGIVLGPFERALTALYFQSLEILVSGSITSESKILIHRNVFDRVNMIAPFLTYDDDPYIVIDNGRLYWMLDAYTVSNKYPYSEEYLGINYIRNPVKVVVDAYTGEVSYYVIEDEPLIQTYSKIFPGLFKPFEEMPQGLKEHVRYPEGLFDIQTMVYSTYHMKDVRVFYNKEDVWNIPSELYESNKVNMESYYLVMQLPEEQQEEFVLLQTFSPQSKNNIIAWMAARSDVPNYGEMLLYNFPKEKFIAGPMQLEARIDQDPEISQLFTLWSQAGSGVIRGHITILPIEDSLLYIEPIYLRARQEAALPELIRVIVSYGDKIVMEDTLDKALENLFSGTVKTTDLDTSSKDIEKLSEQALEYYNAAQTALKDGDWAAYGEEQEKLRQILEEIAK